MGRQPGTSAQSTSVAAVADAVRERILDGRLAPGARLVTERLAAELGVSRAPVREALRALAGQGLVEVRDRRGARVVDADAPPVTALIEIIEVRRQLEPWAAAEAASAASEATIDDLRRLLVDGEAAARAGDQTAAGRAHHDLLLAIVEAADHPMLLATCRPLIDRTAVVFRRVDQTDLPDGWAAHRSTVAAIAARDRRLAAATVRRHLDDVVSALRRG